ncbi:DUF2280 domain-containing protein [Acinetobacter johnsonii]|uniref:DUF2280 domain-containing protein n=1 Tax=Acinetobacter johnsonii TaxID=40214 RepID=UPI000DB832FC|nr:DUF2280 domain-containing protein [Acinetobacter johnsonii]MDH0713099.1 DUF2280 domain-containing protein [Acinetobacter johnsonii]PZO95276.1 MAG: hypothetical protein DI631_03305 [Acinetobacter johnsonii]
MAALKEPVKIFIVQSLACFETPQQVADAVQQRFGIEIDRRQCEGYDPTKFSGRNLSKKLKDLFIRTRKDFKSNIYDIPLANKAVRLNELQKMYEDWNKNKKMKQNIIKQIKDEMHGYELQLLDAQLKQLEIDKIKNGDGEGADDPTPVKVTIQVVDASKSNAEHQSDPECTSG